MPSAPAPAVVSPAPSSVVVPPASAQHSAKQTTGQLSSAASSHQLSAPAVAGQAKDKAQATASAQESASNQLDAPHTAEEDHQGARPTATEQDAPAAKDRQESVPEQRPANQQALTTAAVAEARSANGGDGAEDSTFKLSPGSSPRAGPSRGKLAGKPAVASVPNNPRFAPRPVLHSNTEVEMHKGASQSPDSHLKGQYLITNLFESLNHTVHEVQHLTFLT